MNEVILGSRAVGPGHPCFVIAEAGVNHNGDVAIARQLIDAAADAGADAVKFQSFITEDLIVPNAQKADYQVSNTGPSGSQFEMLKALELDEAQHAELKAHCESAGILYLCTPYENESADRLERIGSAAFKIASADATNLPFLHYLGGKGLPVILSTGMCDLEEVRVAMEVLHPHLDGRIVLLHCTSEYPAPLDETNLAAMDTLRETFDVPVGFSDHTEGIGAAPWAVARGCAVLEKHLTLDRSMSGPDHRASLEPKELAALIREVRSVESAIGDGIKRPTPSEMRNRPLMQRSLVTRRDIAAGEVIQAGDLCCKRPGTGLAPGRFHEVTGRKVLRDLQRDHVLEESDIGWDS